MNILFVSNVHPTPVQPTQGVFNHELLRALRDRGHAVRSIVPIPWHQWLRDRARFVATDSLDVQFPAFWYPPALMRWSYHIWMRWSIGGAVRRATRDRWAEGVLAFWIHPDGRCAVEIGESLGIPSALIAGGSDLLVVTKDARRRAAVSHTLRRANAVLAVGRPLAERAIALGAPREHTHIFRRGVDPRRFGPGDRGAARQELALDATRQIVLWIGNLVAVKDVGLLLEAHASLPAPRPLLVLIGDGPDAAQLRQRAQVLGTAGDVRFEGRVAHGQLGSWYRSANLVALSSRSEGTPNVLLEASACGVPFVSTDVGSVSELVTTADRIVPSRDPVAFGAAIAEVLATPGSRHGKVPVARSWTDAVLQIEHLLQQPGRTDGRTSA